MEYREDYVLVSPYISGWFSVVVVPLPKSDNVEVRVEWQADFDVEPEVKGRWVVEPTMASLRENNVSRERVIVAAILRCFSKARAQRLADKQQREEDWYNHVWG